MKTSVPKTMRTQLISMDELIGTLMSSEAKLMDEENNSKGKKVITFKTDYDDVSDQTSSEDEDDEDMVLLIRKFKNMMRKGRT